MRWLDILLQENRLRALTDAARTMGVSRTTLHHLLTSGAIAYVRLPGGERRIPDGAVRAWIEKASIRNTMDGDDAQKLR